MLEIGFLMLVWNLDPVPKNDLRPRVSRSITTCIHPTIKNVEPEKNCVSGSVARVDHLEIESLLSRWEESTRQQSPLSRSQMEELQHAVGQQFNQHTAADLIPLIGPVRADRLQDRYQWAVVQRSRGSITLAAMSRDEMDRLFYHSVIVSLSLAQGLPEQIDVRGRNLQQQLVWKSQRKSDFSRAGNQIQLVGFEQDLPPTPQAVRTTEDARSDSDRPE